MMIALRLFGISGTAILALLPARAFADLELPRESPPARLTQQVGLTEITLDYSSPAVRGRRIWGGVVPYDKPWSISSNQFTTIRFSKEAMFGNRPVPAGTYRLAAVPAKAEWTMILTRVADTAGNAPAADGRGELPAVKVRVPVRANPFRERLTFFFSNFGNDKASLDLEWEKVRVSVAISVNTADEIDARIKELDSAWRSYANAARYMLETTKDFDAGLKYANQSLALKEDWYTLWIKAALLAAKGDYPAARESGARAYELGQKLGDGFVLEPELKKALADWDKRR